MSERERDHEFGQEAEEEEAEEGDAQPPEPSSPYAILGVDPDATSAQVRIAYYRGVREHPPERDPEGFKRIREAYETLRSPRKRAELALLEPRRAPAEFDLGQLRAAPPPTFPVRCLDHLLAAALAEVDASLDDQVAVARGVGSSARPGNGNPDLAPRGTGGRRG